MGITTSTPQVAGGVDAPLHSDEPPQVRQDEAAGRPSRTGGSVATTAHDTVLTTTDAVSVPAARRVPAMERARVFPDRHVRDELPETTPITTKPVKQLLAERARLEAERRGLNVTVTTRGPKVSVPGPVTDTLGSCIAEAVLNVRKHARTWHVDVAIITTSNGIAVSVMDNGVGCNPENVRNRQTSLHRRAGEAGLTLDMDSVPGELTTVALRWDWHTGATPSLECATHTPATVARSTPRDGVLTHILRLRERWNPVTRVRVGEVRGS
jgi:hypothetical protein